MEIIARSAPFSKRKARRVARKVGGTSNRLESAKLNCDVLWLAVPDAAVEEVSNALAQRAELPPVILHASGALGSQALRALAGRGVHTGSAHPMMTFVEGDPPSLRGAWFALEGDSVAVRAARVIAGKLGAKCFTIEPESKALYHAFGAMLSPMLAAELAAAEKIGLRTGILPRDIRSIMEPIVMRTVTNLLRNGAEKSFSGPLARGDVRTVALHLDSLGRAPEATVYRALAEYAIEVLPVKKSDEMKKLLRRGRARAR